MPVGAGPESITTIVDVARSWGGNAVDNGPRAIDLPDGQISEKLSSPGCKNIALHVWSKSTL
jgi:hypothetical protein